MCFIFRLEYCAEYCIMHFVSHHKDTNRQPWRGLEVGSAVGRNRSFPNRTKERREQAVCYGVCRVRTLRPECSGDLMSLVPRIWVHPMFFGGVHSSRAHGTKEINTSLLHSGSAITLFLFLLEFIKRSTTSTDDKHVQK